MLENLGVNEDEQLKPTRLPSPMAETEDLKSSQCGFESHGSYCECSSAAELRFSKPMVVGSNPIVRLDPSQRRGA